MKSPTIRLVALCAGLLLSAWAGCLQPAAAQAQKPQPTPAPAALADPAPAAGEPAGPEEISPAPIVVANRTVAVLQKVWNGYPPEIRARDAEIRVREQIQQGFWRPVTAVRFAEGYRILIADHVVFNILDGDVNALGQDTPEQVKNRVVADLQEALQASWEQRQPAIIARGVALALLGTGMFVLLMWGCLHLLGRLQDSVYHRTPASVTRMHAELAALFTRPLWTILNWLFRIVMVLVMLVFAYNWISVILRLFPWTQPWGEAMRGFALGQLGIIGRGFLAALPGLGFVLLVVLITKAVTKVLELVFLAVEEKKFTFPGLYPETVAVTRRLVLGILWIFALIIAYPYLPGSGSQAFEGVSIMVGLIVTFGSSGVVNQMASGFVLAVNGLPAWKGLR